MPDGEVRSDASLWVFAHPDDEAFGPGLALAALADRGHPTRLYTLTRGGASRLRHDLGLTRRELEDLRARELRQATAVLGCDSLRVGHYPDGELASCDRQRLVADLLDELRRSRPALVVTLPPHGINGHPDHCTTSAVVAQAWWQWRHEHDRPSRLAWIQLPRAVAEAWNRGTHGIDPASADIRMPITAALRERGRRALACHQSQAEVIAEHQPLDRIGDELLFETVDERHRPALDDLLAQLPMR